MKTKKNTYDFISVNEKNMITESTDKIIKIVTYVKKIKRAIITELFWN